MIPETRVLILKAEPDSALPELDARSGTVPRFRRRIQFGRVGGGRLSKPSRRGSQDGEAGGTPGKLLRHGSSGRFAWFLKGRAIASISYARVEPRPRARLRPAFSSLPFPPNSV